MLGAVAEEFADARAHERVLALQVEHQNQVRKAFEQARPELFLVLYPPLQGAFLGDVHQRALIADNLSRFHHAGGGVHAHRDATIFFSKAKFAGTRTATLASSASENWLAVGCKTQLFRRQG